MPWKESSPMDQRTLFVADHLKELFSMTELCERFGISRQTGYKWLARFRAEGPVGLLERSRRPQSCPHQTPQPVVDAVLEARRLHPRWGAKKLLAILKKRHPDWSWPARSTVCDILKRQGCIAPRRRRRRPGHPGKPLTPMTAPNEIWTADFKGHFRTGDGQYCYPLTVADGFSRYILGCQGLLSPSLKGTQTVFKDLFREFGLPRIIRTDNGAPFATCAIRRLSRLSIWWIRLGIYPELIEPSHPEQNGRHERMHRTLKAETTRPPAPTCRAQQRRFDRFLDEFNNERPHEALGQQTPSSVYRPSTSRLPKRLPKIEYPLHYEIRRVSRNGGIRWNSQWVNVGTVLEEQYVGLEEVDNGLWEVYFGPLKLGRLDEQDYRIEDSRGRKRRRKVSTMSPD